MKEFPGDHSSTPLEVVLYSSRDRRPGVRLGELFWRDDDAPTETGTETDVGGEGSDDG